MVTFESHIQGIPCQISVDYYSKVKGSYSYNAASDGDYYGYTESEWTVLDRKGYKADWLAKKLTKDDEARIESEIEQALKKEANEY